MNYQFYLRNICLLLVFIFPAMNIHAQNSRNAEALPIIIGKEQARPAITLSSTEFIDANVTAPPVPANVVITTKVVTIPAKSPAPEILSEVVPLPIANANALTNNTAAGRESVAPTLSPEAKKERLELLNSILKQAFKQSQNYNQVFRDLSAEETRVSAILQGDKIKETRTVITDLVVYQSRLDSQLAYEFRSAKAVDGKPLKVDEKRLGKLFEQLLNAKTTKKELDLLNNEGFQHDLIVGGYFYGQTLFQWREIMDWALPDVGFDIAGRDKIDDRDVVVIYFQQINQNPQLAWTLPKNRGFERGQQRTKGFLYFDATTMQLRKAERELWLHFPLESSPVRVWKQTMQYKESPYGILVPSKFSAEYFYYFSRDNESKLVTVPSGRLISTFGEFKRFNVTSQEEKKKTVINQ